MKVICEEQTFRELSEPLILSQSDDAWHPIEDPNYIEWWYFDMMNTDASSILLAMFPGSEKYGPVSGPAMLGPMEWSS